MNVLSLFDGMSCGMIALERAEIKFDNYYASEIDKHAIKVSESNYPNIIRLGDVIEWPKWDLPEIDLLIGGSPCQGFSFAGKQLNFDDPRSQLFFEYVKILKEYKPSYFLLENVKMSKKSEKIISEMLGVEPFLIKSEFFSAQLRDRLYWTNIPIDLDIEYKDIKLKDIIEYGYVDREKSYCIDANYFKGGNPKSYFEKSRRQLVFKSEEDYNSILRGEENKNYRKLTPLECERLQNLPENYTMVPGVSNTQRYKMIGNGWTVDVISHILKGLKNDL